MHRGYDVSTATIYRLNIERFRGIKSLSWSPAKGVNVIIGGGDVGKTTILEAIGLLLSPTNPATVPVADYYAGDVEAGFTIEAIMQLSPESGVNDQSKHAWPWLWNGSEAVVPSTDVESEPTGQPVYRFRVRGTADLELVYETIQPDESTDSFRVALRRDIGLVRLAGDDRNDRDLRLVYGSALNRLLSDKGLRSRLGSKFVKNTIKDELVDSAEKALVELDEVFKRERLPDQLDLAMIGSPGQSLTALIGLTANRDGVRLPVASWGAGTRRFAALAIAEQNQGESPITLVDEVERGLEPYRQRLLMNKLQKGDSQVFLTTHSPSVISAANQAALWYVDHIGGVGLLDATTIARHRKTDPEMFLARLAVVAEGATEVGFVSSLLEKALASLLEQHGIYVSDGGGHESTLGLLEALAAGGLRFGGFVDDEQKHLTRWEAVATSLGKLLFRWQTGCIEENVIAAVPDDQLEALVADPAGLSTGMRLRTLADRLNIRGKEFETIKAAAGSEMKQLIIAAALGTVPEGKSADRKQYKSQAQTWFKSVEGGRELCEKVFSLGVWPDLKPQLMPFCNAVRKVAGLPEILEIR